MTKKIIALLLIVVMLTSLAACGSGSATTQTSETTSVSGDSQPETTQAPENDNDTPSDTVSDPHVSGLVDKIGGASETFKGTLSENTFLTQEAAVKGYLLAEVAGDKNVDIQEIKSLGELTPAEITAAGIPADLIAGADSVEKMELGYEVIGASSLDGGVSLLASEKKTIVVYVVKYGNKWQYFTPCPVTGDTITKTYYDSVFNAENYKNCTMESTVKTYMSTKASDGVQSMEEVAENTIYQMIKYADGKIYMEQKVTSTSSSSGTTTNEIYFYLEETEDGETLCYVKTSADAMWSYGSLYSIGFTSVEQLTPFYNQYLDYTYFTKTDYGFALADDNARAYFTKAFSALAGSFASLTENMDFEMLAKYVVKNGALSAMINTAVVGMNYSEMGATVSMLVKADSEITCTNYGTTYIERPNVD